MTKRSNKSIGKALAAVRRTLLAVSAFCCLLGLASPGWALKAGGEGDRLLLPEYKVENSDQVWLPTLYSSADRKATAPGTAIVGQLQLRVGRAKKVSFEAFSYGGRAGYSGLSFLPKLNLGASVDQATEGWTLPKILPTTALAAARTMDDQAQSFKVGLDGGRGKVSMSLQNVGAKFNAAATGLQATPQQDLEALTKAAGTRSFNLQGSLQLWNSANFTSNRTSVYNDKPGDGNRGQTSTDWVNALALSLGKSTSMRLALTDHNENWDASTGKVDTRRRTTEVGGETKFGAGGQYNLRFGLTDVHTTNGAQQSSEQTQELHLALPLASRLKLNGDYTRKSDGAGNSTTTNLVTGVMQLLPGAELTSSLKTITPSNGKQTQETYLKLTSGLGHGASTAQLFAEQTLTQTPDQGMVKNAKVDVNGGWGKGTARLNLHGLFQERRGDQAAGPLESLTNVHLDRGFGPRLTLTADYERTMKGTVATYDESEKSVVGLTMALAKQTKLTAGFSSRENRDASGPHVAWNRDVLLEQRLGGLQVRAEDHRRLDAGVEIADQALGVDWAKGSLPDWAQSITRKHEFGDIYEYQIAKEASWLDTPFAGTRLWMKRRTGGQDDGVRSLLASHRTVVAKRYHLQLTYQDRPEYDDGDQKGRPQQLRREFVDVGTKVARGLVGHTWAQQEQKVSDPASQRRTMGLGISGRMRNQAQAEVYYSRTAGQWEGATAQRQALAVLYDRPVDQDHKLTTKVGYAWGASVANGRDPEYRFTLAYANPI